MAATSDYGLIEKMGINDAHVLRKKGETYGDSWKKRGGVGAFMMLARKWDRIEQQVSESGYDVFAAIEKDSTAEGLLDDIRDLRRYLLLVDDEMSRRVRTEVKLPPEDPASTLRKMVKGK